MTLDGLPDDAWLVIIDPQVVFASVSSEWGSPMFPAALAPMRALAERYTGRTIVTRFVPELPPQGSWADYYASWPFAARPGDDEMYALVPEIADVAAGAHRVDERRLARPGHAGDPDPQAAADGRAGSRDELAHELARGDPVVGPLRLHERDRACHVRAGPGPHAVREGGDVHRDQADAARADRACTSRTAACEMTVPGG